MEWKEVKLGELIQIKYGKDHKKLNNGSIPVYGSGGIMRYVDQYLYDNESILIPRKGTLNNIFYVTGKFWTVDTLFWSKINNSKVFGKFLYYYLKTINFTDMNVGSAVPSLTTKILNEISIKLPPLPIQKKIAHILSTLDEKIELNRKMNKTLEAMAQAIFKSWFVDFDPVHAKARAKTKADLQTEAKKLGITPEILELFPSEFEESELGMIPKGWEVSTIGEEVSIYGGATPSTKEEKYWKDGKNNWVTPKDLSKLNSKVLLDTERKITDKGVSKISSKQLPIGTVLLSSRAPVGYIAYSAIPISINQGFIAMVCDKKLSNYYVLYWLTYAMDEIKNRAAGTTFSEISKSAFRPIKLLLPDKEIRKKFDSIVQPIVNNLIENEIEIQTLQQTRNTLLPKLLSGELDVSEVEI